MTGRIVVGIDGSTDSQRALQWAFGEARLREAELVLVHTWEYPISFENPPSDIEHTHAEILAGEAARVANRGVRVRTELIQGRPVHALVRIAADADLLVVGSRGHNRMRRAVLGSVSTGCVHHASCPVVVIRADAPAPLEDLAPETVVAGSSGPRQDNGHHAIAGGRR